MNQIISWSVRKINSNSTNNVIVAYTIEGKRTLFRISKRAIKDINVGALVNHATMRKEENVLDCMSQYGLISIYMLYYRNLVHKTFLRNILNNQEQRTTVPQELKWLLEARSINLGELEHICLTKKINPVTMQRMNVQNMNNIEYVRIYCPHCKREINLEVHGNIEDNSINNSSMFSQ